MRAALEVIFLTSLISMFSTISSSDNWTQKNPSNQPSARRGHAMAYIGNYRVLLFGGIDESLNNETWIFDISHNTWTQKFPSTKPSPRSVHSMAYIGDDNVILFGGVDGSHDDETWVYDFSDNTWTNKESGKTWVSGVDKPSRRMRTGLAYIGDDKVLLFGGEDYNITPTNDTWVYDLSDNEWLLKSIPNNEKPRTHAEAIMSYIGDDKVLLHVDSTWVYDLSDNSWTYKNPSNAPPLRGHSAIAYKGGDQVIKFGGGTYYNETWIYDLSVNNWSEQNPSSKPSGRLDHDIAYTNSGSPVLFGGSDGDSQLDDETWVWDDESFLPVELTSFTAYQKSNFVKLTWITESELNTKGFYILRATGDNTKLRIISSLIPSKSQRTNRNEYDFVDFSVEQSGLYFYTLRDIDYNGIHSDHGPLKVNFERSVGVLNSGFVGLFKLSVYPNPFNPSTSISWHIPGQKGIDRFNVKIVIHDVRGRQIRTLEDSETTSGIYNATWDGRDDNYKLVCNGIYFSRLFVDGVVRTENKMVLVK